MTQVSPALEAGCPAVLNSLDRNQISAPVPAEYRGMARTLITRARKAHSLHNRLVNRFAAEIRARCRKHPGRSIPADMLSGIAQRWRAAEDEFRLSFVANLKNTKGVLCEGRIGFHNMIRDAWGTDENGAEIKEPNLLIVFASLTVTKSEAQLTVKADHSFSFHSLARFYERSGCVEDHEVIEAMTKALTIDPKDHKVGDDVVVSNSGWRGTILRRSVGDNDWVQLWNARTWWQ